MKKSIRKHGTTLLEMSVTLGIVATAGASFFWILSAFTSQFSKNNAVNLSHQEARGLINNAVQQIHSSASIPQLVNTSLVAVTGNGPAAGVSYQTVVLGPGTLSASAAAGQKVVAVTMPGTPAAGMRMVVPGFPQNENDIASVSGSGTSWQLTLVSNLPAAMSLVVPVTNPVTPTPIYQVFCTQRSALLVKNNNLYFYHALTTTNPALLATNVTTPASPTSNTPFSIPGGNNQFVEANFSTSEPNATALGYHAVNLQMTINVPYRYQLTSGQ